MELFTVEPQHILILSWIIGMSIAILAPNKNDYYTYNDRILGWFGGLIVGFVTAIVIL